MKEGGGYTRIWFGTGDAAVRKEERNNGATGADRGPLTSYVLGSTCSKSLCLSGVGGAHFDGHCGTVLPRLPGTLMSHISILYSNLSVHLVFIFTFHLFFLAGKSPRGRGGSIKDWTGQENKTPAARSRIKKGATGVQRREQK